MLLRAWRDVLFLSGDSRLECCRNGVRACCLPCLSALILVACAATSSFAVPINYGDFMGQTVNYLMVQEDANSPPPDAPPLFGKPTVLQNPYPALPCTIATCTIPGDTLDFTPVGFAASASGAGGNDITDGNLAFMVQAKPGQSIKNIKIKEFGDTTMSGTVPLNSNATATVVRMPVFIDIVEVNGLPITPIKLSDTSVPAIVATFTPSNGDYYLGIDGNGGPFFTTTWSGELFANLEAVMKGITKITVNLDNVLIATSELNTSALIAKKDFFIVTTNVPEPSTCGLVLVVIAVGGCVARRRGH